jgi:diacylglycerol kinase (ATP)
MAKDQKPASQIKLIYNPHAGTKRRILPNPHKDQTSLEDIKELLEQYEFQVDLAPTKAPSHATTLAKEAINEGYKVVVAAGGDGTVGEVANGLVNSDVTLGIIPLGSFMNVAKMLSLPLEIEKAVQLLKIGLIRKIDVGSVTRIGGEKLDQPYYFLESAGLGLEAQLHEYIVEWEKGNPGAFFKVIKSFFDYYGHRALIHVDNQKVETKATLVTVSNGPYTGANLPLAPQAKLNDHKLSVRIFRMTKIELVKYFLRAIRIGKTYNPKITTLQGKKVRIETRTPRLVHADARLFGKTPVEFNIVPNALNVITGFPKKGESSLVKRTYLEP